MDFWDIVIPALAGGILGPIYARWFRWWRRSRKQSKKKDGLKYQSVKVLLWPPITLQEWNLHGHTSG